MKFRTEIEVHRGLILIEHHQPLLTLGSCFAENMAHKLSALRFNVLENPFGVLYNPASILAALQLLNGQRKIEENDLVFNDGLWHSLLHHSVFSDARKETLLEHIRAVNVRTAAFLKEAKHVLLTFGTAFVYRYLPSGKTVANCHKIPAKQFDRLLLSAEEVSKILSESIQLLKNINPALHIIVTVSPIRHIKDGLVQNQLSKATLLTGIHKALQDTDQTVYFPAYEIVIDDLRDYRFYEENLTHPNALAQEYIWKKFEETYFSNECRQAAAEMERLNKALNHRPFHPQSQAHQRFIQTQLAEIKQLKKKYPYIDFSPEERLFKEQLS